MAATPENLHPVDAIITVGLQLKDDGSPEPELIQRVRKTFELFNNLSERQTPPALIMSGKYSVNATVIPPWAEATVMTDLIVDWGVPRDKVIVEDESMDTWDNAAKVKRIAQELGFKRMIIVSREGREVIFRHMMGPEHELTFMPPDIPLTPDVIEYEKIAAQTAQAIIETTEAGDDAAIEAKLHEVLPAYQTIADEPLAQAA